MILRNFVLSFLCAPLVSDKKITLSSIFGLTVGKQSL